METHHPETGNELSRAELDALREPTVIEFGTAWCHHCQGAQPLIAEAFAAFRQLRHLKVEDGPGRALGRSYRVKLWPTLIFLQRGEELERLVRPPDAESIRQALARLVADAAR